MQIFRDFNTEQKHLCWILYCAFGLKYNKHKIFFYNHLKCTIYNQHEKSFLFVLGTGLEKWSISFYTNRKNSNIY